MLLTHMSIIVIGRYQVRSLPGELQPTPYRLLGVVCHHIEFDIIIYLLYGVDIVDLKYI